MVTSVVINSDASSPPMLPNIHQPPSAIAATTVIEPSANVMVLPRRWRERGWRGEVGMEEAPTKTNSIAQAGQSQNARQREGSSDPRSSGVGRAARASTGWNQSPDTDEL
jgi:hypothetical protein